MPHPYCHNTTCDVASTTTLKSSLQLEANCQLECSNHSLEGTEGTRVNTPKRRTKTSNVDDVFLFGGMSYICLHVNK